MRTLFVLQLVVVSFFMFANAQQAPKSNHSGNPVSIIRNDSTGAVAIECHTEGQWQQVKLDAGSDATISGDRVRVSTTRQDNAIVTVDLPIQAGKKYRLIWNTQAGIWDFSQTS